MAPPLTIHLTYQPNAPQPTQSENDDIIQQAVKKIIRVSVDIFHKLEASALPMLTKLIRSQGIAESIFYGSVSAFVTRLAFVLLGLPTDNIRLNIFAYYVSYEYFKPNRESHTESTSANKQVPTTPSPNSVTIEISDKKPN